MKLITTYNKKGFLLPDSIRSMAAYHAKITHDNLLIFRINDCNRGIRLWNYNTDPEEVAEMAAKLRCLANAANEFADFIETEYRQAPSATPEPRSMADIIDGCARVCGFTYEQIVARDRHEKLHTVRQLIYMRLRAEGCSYSQIGRLFGRSHSTVILAVQSAERLIAVNDPLIMEFQQKLISRS
jgi:chromosomal replication initiation ATPase DnaA